VSTPARASSKKIRPPKQPKPTLSSSYKGTSQGPKQARLAHLRDGSVGLIKSPSTPTETSSSEAESSSEESESEYEDEMAPVKELHEVSFDPSADTT